MEMGELLKLFGVLILVTWFEFNSQRDLWKPLSDNKFIPGPAIGATTGMSSISLKSAHKPDIQQATRNSARGDELQKLLVETG
jgi:hypothetical protein